MALLLRQLFKTFGNALVRVTQALFKAQHFFAYYRKAEVARLDSSRMHWSHCNFMHAIAFDLNERVGLRITGELRCAVEVSA